MKISDYIRHLQELKNKHGDVDVKVNRTFECADLSINDTYEDVEKPIFDKDQNCVVIYDEFLSYD